MSDHGAADAGQDAGGGGSGGSKLPLILALVNVLVVLGALGMLVYTRFLFKRPPITEEAERERLVKTLSSPVPLEPGFVTFEPVTVNIAGNDKAVANGGKLHYATIGFSLEIRDSQHKATVENVKPLIMDKFLGVLGRRQFQDLTNVQGRYVLRNDLIDISNQIIAANAGRIQPSAPAAKEGGEAGGHGGGGGEHGGGGGHGGGHDAPKGAAHGGGHDAGSHEAPPIRGDLVTNVYFSQFVVQ